MDSHGARAADRPPNPRARASPLSALTFAWVVGILRRGYQRDLEVEDLAQPLAEHRSDLLGDTFEKYWADEQVRAARRKGTRPSLTRVIVRVFGVRLALYGVILAIQEMVRVAQPVFLGRLVLSFSDDSEVPRDAAMGYAAGVALCAIINVMVTHPYFMGLNHMGMKMRVGCSSLLYRKTLRLSKGGATAGQVVNLLSNDVARFEMSVIFLHYLWVGPIATVLACYFMYYELGYAAIVGVVTILMFIPLQGYLGKRVSALRLRTAVRTDERVRYLNEIIAGVKVIKMYTWEIPFNKLVAATRRRELKCIAQSLYIRGVLLSFIMYNTRISIFASILAYVLTGGIVTAEKVFVITGYYNILRQTMAYFFPFGYTQLAEALVSVERIEKYLLQEESPAARRPTKTVSAANVNNVNNVNNVTIVNNAYNANDVNNAKNANSNNVNNANNVNSTAHAPAPAPAPALTPPFAPHADPGVELSDASAKWTGDATEDTLSAVSLRIGAAQRVAVVGQVGAGKTSLLHALLQELPLRAGALEVRGRVSYASQEPWMFAGSVRQNILFGEPLDRQRYNQVLKACDLVTDMQQLPYGDETDVSERGISLSGGQRARINLARAVYKEADIYLLDDPLSAVDAHVGKHLFDKCIKGHLAGKVVLLVTHQLQYLNDMDKIYIMGNGSILQEGTFADLKASGSDLLTWMRIDASDADETTSNEHTSTPSHESDVSASKINEKSKVPEVKEESRSQGVVSSQVYVGYFAAGGNWCVITLMFLVFIAAQIAGSGADYWITYWTEAEEYSLLNQTNSTFENVTIPFGITHFKHELLTREDFIYIYTGLIGAVVILSLIRCFVFFRVCIRASQRLHDTMLYSVTHAKMHFFNTNPSGRIQNRFSKDMGAMDEILPNCMMDALQIILVLLGIIVVVVAVNYWLIFPTLFVGVTFYLLRMYFLVTSRSVKRLEGITRSPVLSHVNASLQGLTTIRACSAEDILIKEFDNHQDLHSSAWYVFTASSRAFGFWLDSICVAFVTFVTFSFFITGTDVFGGNVGLAITQAIGLTSMFQWGMRQSAEVENQMTSVERIMEYSNLDQEAPLESSPGKKPPPEWPQQGRIVFNSVSLKYNPSEAAVLKNLNFTIQPGEKIGIVGRTGAGKTSLINALFRLADLEGTILLDEVNTANIGLLDLRHKISIIPQEPVLFAGSLRKNLDPFDKFQDAVLLRALDEVELCDMVRNLPAGLSTKVSEGGTNFSVGERQLVCLARAILRKNRVLVLDEATANVDSKTDALIQETIRQKFATSTVLTIAHRLNTIMDSNRVLVMDEGCMVEFGRPHNLLQNTESHFYKMVQTTGMAEQLTQITEVT